jgi:cyclopropane-fatty-acyl-phospholipid synthase
MKPFVTFFRLVIRTGHLAVIDAEGRRHTFGDGTGKPAVMRLLDKSLHRRLAYRPSLAVGEGYMDGTLVPDEGTSLQDLLTLLMHNDSVSAQTGFLAYVSTFQHVIGRWLHANPIWIAKRNVAHHYDLKDELFDLFLDRDQQYSCAYFAQPDDSLDTAQTRKKKLLGRKLLLESGMRVLDIGSGWGGLGLSLAMEHGVDVTGLTLSERQLARSNKRARDAGLSHRCRFLMRDYRKETGTYDRIVSVGMFEHVGLRHYKTYFEQVKRLLNDDGVAVIHSIGAFNRAGETPAWMRKYIFPGAYVPTLSEVTPVVERSGLKVTDIEIWRLHYAETLRHWRRNFMNNRETVRALYDERFCRMWEFYLTACEVAFRLGEIMVFQLQIAKRQDAVPLTRDYLFNATGVMDEAAAARHAAE